jgi:PIN domain nuclease of toxin-antitoxin system
MPKPGACSVSRILLDTCAVLWLANGEPIEPQARSGIASAALYVSPITGWEIANLVRKNRIALTMPVAGWLQQALTALAAELTDLSLALLVESCALPGAPPDDPADRILIATARSRGLAIATRDAAILRYAGAGHVKILRC